MPPTMTPAQLEELRKRTMAALEAETSKTREERARFLVRSLGTGAMIVAGWLSIEADALDRQLGAEGRVLELRELARALEDAIEAEGA